MTEHNKSEIPKNTFISKGTYTDMLFKDPRIQDRETDAFYKTDHRLPHSNVSIPTYDAVVEAKEWVDDENRK